MRKTIGMWALGLSLCFGAGAFAKESEPAASSWQEMTAKNKECLISFPSVPQLIQQVIPVADGSAKLYYDLYVAPFEEKGVFLLLVATYPAPLTGGHEIAGLEGLLKGIVGHHPDNKLMYAELVQFFGMPAVNFLVQSGESYFRGQAVMVGNKLYLIAMEGAKEGMNEAVFARFLQSFKLLKK